MAQSKPETKMSGKETEAEAQRYRFEQHKKIKETLPERSEKHEGSEPERRELEFRLSFTIRVTFDKCHNFSKILFPHVQNRDINNLVFLLRELSCIKYKGSKQTFILLNYRLLESKEWILGQHWPHS